MKFKICNKCGALVRVINDCSCANCGIICCGEPMKEIIPNSQDASVEKHVPVINILPDNKVSVIVGETPHPMIEAHYIAWIMLKTNLGEYTHYLKPNDEPKTTFLLQENEKVESAICYCNLHGLWQKNMEN